MDGLFMEHDTAELRDATMELESGYQQVHNALPMQPDEARAMREAIQIADSVHSNRIDLTGLFNLIGSSFARQPSLKMTEFAWQTVNAREQPYATDPTTDAGTVPQQARQIFATVSGRLRHFDGNYKQAHSTVESLLHDLKAQPGVVRVELTRTPLDIRESSEIQGELNGNTAQSKAEFDLEIVLEAIHEAV